MELVFDKIAEIEKRAMNISAEVDAEKNSYSQKLEAEFEKLDRLYDEKLSKLVEDKTYEEEKKSDDIINQLCELQSKSISELQTYFKDNMAEWEEKIFKNITE